MALISCQYFSDVIGCMSKMVVILPQEAKNRIGMDSASDSAANEKFQVLYLLHGLSDDETVWTRRTSIERYASELKLAVVMPTTHRSWYTDAKQGYKYYTHIAEEVPRIAQSFFPLSDKREDNFIAGLSMGGYGALKIALRNPERFSAAASLSGALDINSMHAVLGDPVQEEFLRIFGTLEERKGSEDDLFSITQNFAASTSLSTAIYQCCGTEDFLYEMNQSYRKLMETLDFDYTYDESPGTHNWQYWDDKIQDILRWLPKKGEIKK